MCLACVEEMVRRLEPVGSVVCVGIVVLSTGVSRGGW